MLETRDRHPISTAGSTARAFRGPRSRLELELRDVAAEVAGRLDRDELSREQEELVADAIDAAVDAALPAVIALLDRELTPRLEALPLDTRLTLARARGRRDVGQD